MKQIPRLTAGVIGLACTVVAAGTVTVSRPPNIVFILADDLGYGEVSFNGQQRFSTPHLDRLAAQGMIFSQAYAGAPICAPSRNCLLTGQHTGHTTVRNNFANGSNDGARISLKPADITIAQRLSDAGYRTAMIGKWGLGEEETAANPWSKGWGFFYGFVNQKQAHNQFPEFLYRNQNKEPQVANFARKEGVYANDRFTAEALDFITRTAAEQKPFFLYMSYTTPHAFLRCPQDSVDEVKQLYAWAREPDARESSVYFAGMMRRLDRDVGRLLARLKELGLDENTLVIFTGDNGAHAEDDKDNAFFQASGPFRGIKRDLYEGGIREPYCARWPGRIAPGSRSDHPIAFWDFPATALEIAGVPRPADLPGEGISYAPTLLGRAAAQEKHDYLYWEILIKGEGRQALRAGDWKVVRYGLDAKMELYDLATDPGEAHDVSARHPAQVARLAALLTEAHVDNPDFPLRIPEGAHKPSAKSKNKGTP